MKHALLLFLIVAPLNAFAADTAEGAIQRTYQAHQPWGSGIDFANRAQVARHFDAELTELFLLNEQCEKKTGAICALDHDPLLCAQDWYADDPTVEVQVSFEKPYTHRVYLKSTRAHVSLLMKKTNSGWRISDVQCHDPTVSLKQLMFSAKLK
jgi:hypothetical protein